MLNMSTKKPIAKDMEMRTMKRMNLRCLATKVNIYSSTNRNNAKTTASTPETIKRALSMPRVNS